MAVHLQLVDGDTCRFYLPLDGAIKVKLMLLHHFVDLFALRCRVVFHVLRD